MDPSRTPSIPRAVTDPVARLNTALEGRYSIEREVGQGGMATVYLAKDLKHDRSVALKVLKPELAAVVGAERFLAEIKTTANLQHPHILPLFDSGEADSFLFYVMPYVEGETLRDRIDRERQLPVDEAVRIATAVGNALEHAHRQGIIHRDIKPANILLQDGEPVVADFGIALAVGAGGSQRLTETGLSVGTPYYMSPEQATGDQRVGPATDTYALGCVLYEMLIGEPPFPGATAQAVLGRIIAGKPVSATEHRPSIPAHVDGALRCALEKLPADRFTSVHELVRALGDEHFRYGMSVVDGAAKGAGPWNRLAIVGWSIAVFATVVAGWALFRPAPPPPDRPVARFSAPIDLENTPFFGAMALTADGSAVVFVRADGLRGDGQTGQLWIRRWTDLDAYPIRGTEGAAAFALSPDGREIAFTVGLPGPIQVVPLDGGPSRTVVEMSWGVWSWTPDKKLVFTAAGPSGAPQGLALVPARPGATDEIEVITELREGETAHSSLTMLPGGGMAAFQVWHDLSGDDAEVWALDFQTKERRLLRLGHNPKYAASGHLLWGAPDGILMSAPIDPGTAVLSGPAVSVVEGLQVDPAWGQLSYAVAENGTIIYWEGSEEADSQMYWMSRSGMIEPVDPAWRFILPTVNGGWSLSPDGTQVAFTSVPEEGDETSDVDIWVKELPDGASVRITFDDQPEFGPAWTPDGRYVSYVKGEGTELDVWRVRAAGSGVPELLLDDDLSLFQGDWSRDGEWLILRTASDNTTPGQRDIVGFRPGLDEEVSILVATEAFDEVNPSLSPDGRWLLYSSNATGQWEVYVRPFPIIDSPPIQVSIGSGSSPQWANSGKELFYISGENMIAVAIRMEGEFTILQRETLFPIPVLTRVSSFRPSFDVSLDDQRFLMVGPASVNADNSRIVLVQNFFEVLKERLGN